MINRERLALKLGVKGLEKYIIDEFIDGKNEAKKLVDNYFESKISEIDKIESNDEKKIKLIQELIQIKSVVNNSNNFFSTIINDAQMFASNSFLSIKSDEEKLENLAKYILNFYDFNNALEFFVEAKLKKIKIESLEYHSGINFIINSKAFFDILNDIYKIDRYSWDWDKFEVLVNYVIASHQIELNYVRDKFSLEKEKIEREKNNEIKEFIDKISEKDREILRLEKKNEYYNEFVNKYYLNSNVTIVKTYFGDNLPFIINLFKFLKNNNLYDYGLSYFYICLNVGNKEMIPLTSFKKNVFIGYIFLNLKHYLIEHYVDDYFTFFQSKFLINGSQISKTFKNNYIKKIDSSGFKRELYPELQIVDIFFNEQLSIYMKS